MSFVCFVVRMNFRIRHNFVDRALKISSSNLVLALAVIVTLWLLLVPMLLLLLNRDRKSTRLNSSHIQKSRMPSSA